MYSPLWGFGIDLPEDYSLTGGDGKNNFSFTAPGGFTLDLAIYSSQGEPLALASRIKDRLKSSGDISIFEYGGRKAAMMELNFSMPGSGGASSASTKYSGWGLCLELDAPRAGSSVAASGAGTAASPPLIMALSYAPDERPISNALHFSALDSISPTETAKLSPGPVTDFTFPRETRRLVKLSGIDTEAWFFEEDAEAAQALVDREFEVLTRYENTPLWKEAWARYYRMIFRDSWERLADASFKVERKLNVPLKENRDFANQVLSWVQGFKYERNLDGSDFVNLVAAAVEGRGDCDSRAMLWALVLNQANIPAAIMVSREYSHAMGIAELPGTGARFPFAGKEWLVAETTAKVSTGLINQDKSDIENWLGVALEGF